MSRQSSVSESLLESNKNQTQKLIKSSKIQQQKSKNNNKFLTRLTNIIILITSLIAGASAVFIIINVFLFSYEAFIFGQSTDIEELLSIHLVMLTCKFLMLIMFTAALVMGSLIPLALMYIILNPMKDKQN